MSREAILEHLREYLEEMFEIQRERVTLDAKLFEELDLDSIDAVDLVVKLQDLTGRRIKPEAFKAVRSVGDVVECVHTLMNTDAA
ncbi:MAG: acyl carrier protein [Gemmatimonas sp.]